MMAAAVLVSRGMAARAPQPQLEALAEQALTRAVALEEPTVMGAKAATVLRAMWALGAVAAAGRTAAVAAAALAE